MTENLKVSVVTEQLRAQESENQQMERMNLGKLNTARTPTRPFPNRIPAKLKGTLEPY